VITLSVSSVVLWWRRRPENVLGAPPALATKNSHSIGFRFIVLALAIYLPVLGISLIAVRLTEFLVLRRIPYVRSWLGLAGI